MIKIWLLWFYILTTRVFDDFDVEQESTVKRKRKKSIALYLITYKHMHFPSLKTSCFRFIPALCVYVYLLILVCMNLFQLYNKALIIYKDARPSDALSFILKELRKWEQTVIPDETELKMKRMFDSKYLGASFSSLILSLCLCFSLSFFLSLSHKTSDQGQLVKTLVRKVTKISFSVFRDLYQWR